jgi:hypothetical protein
VLFPIEDPRLRGAVVDGILRLHLADCRPSSWDYGTARPAGAPAATPPASFSLPSTGSRTPAPPSSRARRR